MSLRNFSLLFIFLMFVSLHANANGQTFKNEPDGFRGIKFGSSPKLLSKSFILINHSGEEKDYIKKDEKLKIGGAKIEMIGYTYYKNRLHMVGIHTKGRNNENAVMAAFIAKFGKPNFKDSASRKVWSGKKTTILINCNVISHNCTIVMQSSKITNERLAAKKAAAQKAAKEDF